MPQPDPYWPRFCAALGKPEWATDPRYDSLTKRRDETLTLAPAIETAFAQRATIKLDVTAPSVIQ